VEAAEKIEIRKDSKLTGDIRTARIIIEDGAYFKGSIDIVKPEPVKAGAVVAKAQAPAPLTQAAPAGNVPAAAHSAEIKR
jgi:cytoskeletal protein CcmA (bactofilin family)